MREDNEQRLITALRRDGKVFLPEGHALLAEQTTMQLFHDLCDCLSRSHPEGDVSLNMRTVEGGWWLSIDD